MASLRLLGASVLATLGLSTVACSGTTSGVDAGLDATAPSDAAMDAATPPDAGPDGAPQDAAADAPAEGGGGCTWGDPNGCPKGFYCNAPTCTTGTCDAVGTTETQTRTPVCGCDDVTYWNATVAAARAMPVKATGECKAPKACNDFGMKCAMGTSCNTPLANPGLCAAQIHTGTCWGLPTTCPQIVIGPNKRACGALACAAECDLAKKDTPYYTDNTCPQ